MKNNEKRTYETPVAEKIMFNYCDQVVAASQSTCTNVWINYGQGECTEGNKFQEALS